MVSQQEELFTSAQNVGEFWNVATRPVANNGLGLPGSEVIQLLERGIEPVCGIMFDHGSMYAEYKRLLNSYSIVGKHVHDARLVAMMLTRQIDKILTLNDRDFRRYEPEGITVVTPDTLIAEE